MAQNSQKHHQVDWSAKDLYDMLMYDIEPELLTDSLPELDKLYKGETEQQHKERMQKYAVSFETFMDRFYMLMDTWKIEIGNFKKDLSSHFAGLERGEDNKSIEEIEKRLQDS